MYKKQQKTLYFYVTGVNLTITQYLIWSSGVWHDWVWTPIPMTA